MADVYKVSATENLRALEGDLAKELQELRNEIEENEMVHGLPARTIRYFPYPQLMGKNTFKSFHNKERNGFFIRIPFIVALKVHSPHSIYGCKTLPASTTATIAQIPAVFRRKRVL
jgi:hypothetical protein